MESTSNVAGGRAHAKVRDPSNAAVMVHRPMFGKYVFARTARRMVTWMEAKTTTLFHHVDPKYRLKVTTLRASSSANARPMKKRAAQDTAALRFARLVFARPADCGEDQEKRDR